MSRTFVYLSVMVLSIVTGSGCLIAVATVAGINAAKQVSVNDYLVKTWLDGQAASISGGDKESTDIQAQMIWDVSTSPTFKYVCPDPNAVGSIRTVQLEFFEVGATDTPVYLVYSKNSRRSAQFRPDTEYALRSIGEAFHVIDQLGADAGGVVLQRNTEYLLQVTITGKIDINKHIRFKTRS